MALDFLYRVACSARDSETKTATASGRSSADNSLRFFRYVMLCVLLSHCIKFENLWRGKDTLHSFVKSRLLLLL